MIEQYGKLVFIDLESTGPNPLTDRVTEIGIVEVTRAGVRRWSTLVNPQVPIPPFVSTLTGITDDMVRDAPTFEAVHGEMLQWLQGGLFIAHNARFDYGFLRHEFKRIGKTFRCEVLCTLKLSRKLFPDVISHGLDALVERHAFTTDARHRALGDAEILWQYWQMLERTLPKETLVETARQLLQRPNLPAHLDPDMFDDLPDSPGVYVFFGEGDKALHVIRAPHLRQRVLSHFHGDRPSQKDVELAREAHRLEWEETAGEVGAQLLEARLMRTLQPPAGIGRPTEKDICAWRLAKDIDDGLQPLLAHANQPDFARDDLYYGLFTSPQKAQMALRALADKNGLRIPWLEEHRSDARPCNVPPPSKARLKQALSSLPVLNWPYPGPIVAIEYGDGDRKDLHLIDRWHWLGRAQSEEEIPALLAQAPASLSFEFDTYRIVSRAIAQGKLEVKVLH
jgi:DNA polymerase-3 subunit epsilon